MDTSRSIEYSYYSSRQTDDHVDDDYDDQKQPPPQLCLEQQPQQPPPQPQLHIPNEQNFASMTIYNNFLQPQLHYQQETIGYDTNNTTPSFFAPPTTDTAVVPPQEQRPKTTPSLATTTTSTMVTIGEDRPKRPLSGYNIFFRDARQTLLANRPVRPQGVPRRSHGKIGFAEMARTISQEWNALDPTTKEQYEQMARQERALYKRKLAAWKYYYNVTTAGPKTSQPKKPKTNKKKASKPNGSAESSSTSNNEQTATLPTARVPAAAAAAAAAAVPNGMALEQNIDAAAPSPAALHSCQHRNNHHQHHREPTIRHEVNSVSASASTAPTVQPHPFCSHEEAQHHQFLSSFMGPNYSNNIHDNHLARHHNQPTNNSNTTTNNSGSTQEQSLVCGNHVVTLKSAATDAAPSNHHQTTMMSMIMEQAKLIQEINTLLSNTMGTSVVALLPEQQQPPYPEPLPLLDFGAATTTAAATAATDSCSYGWGTPAPSPLPLPQQTPPPPPQPFVGTMMMIKECDLEPYYCGAVPQPPPEVAEPLELLLAQQLLLHDDATNNHNQDDNPQDTANKNNDDDNDDSMSELFDIFES